MKPGKLGVWAMIDGFTAAEAAGFAERVEAWGYSALWMPEGLGRNVLVTSSWMLANTRRLIVATGIANIYGRDATAMASAQAGLSEQSDGRFLLGMGVSHAPIVQSLRGHHYGQPVAAMREYLLAMRQARYLAPPPAEKPLTVIAALGPKMLQLAAELADGAHPYNVTPEHTAEARAILGPDKLLCVEQKIVLATDPSVARAAGRKTLAPYMTLANYVNNWRRLGFTEEDCAADGSNRLIDAMFAWGDEAAIRRRIEAHWAAGADHVCVQPIDPTGAVLPDERVLAVLAPAA
jgi:probable F420-dependent oxidoreductase